MKKDSLVKLPQELCDNTYALGSALAPMNGSGTARYECFACGHRWDIPRDENWRLPQGFWKCPNGCNKLLAEGLHSRQDTMEAIQLMSAYLAGYMEVCQTDAGPHYTEPDEVLEDILEELTNESPNWVECVEALRFLLDHLVVGDLTVARAQHLTPAWQLVKLIIEYFDDLEMAQTVGHAS